MSPVLGEEPFTEPLAPFLLVPVPFPLLDADVELFGLLPVLPVELVALGVAEVELFGLFPLLLVEPVGLSSSGGVPPPLPFVVVSVVSSVVYSGLLLLPETVVVSVVSVVSSVVVSVVTVVVSVVVSVSASVVV